MKNLIPMLFVAHLFAEANPDGGAGAPPADPVDPAAPPEEKSKLEQLREKAAANQPVPNERAALKAADAGLKAAALAEAKEKLGIQNALEVVQFGVALAKAIDAAKADGKIDLADVGLLFPVAPLVVPMIDGIGHVPKELGDLDEDEMAALMEEAGKILGGVPAQTVKKVRAALKFAHAGYDLYMAFAEK